MPKAISRLGRVALRVARPVASVGKATRLLFWLFGALGVGLAAVDLNRVRPWLLADWTHWVLTIFAVLLFGSITAIYGMEHESEALQIIKLSLSRAQFGLLEVVNTHQGEWRDVFMAELWVSLRNDSEKAGRSFFPTIEVLRKQGRKWEVLDIKFRSMSGQGGKRDEGRLRFGGDVWRIGDRIEVPARDEIRAIIKVLGMTNDGASAFLNEQLKVRVSFDIPGQPNQPTIEAPIPTITGYHYD